MDILTLSFVGSFHSLVIDLWAFLDELVCLFLTGRGEAILRSFCLSALWQIYQTQYLLFRMQECRFITSQDAGIIVLSMGGLDTHSPSLGLHTRDKYPTVVGERGNDSSSYFVLTMGQ
jgi:hypothetical protein